MRLLTKLLLRAFLLGIGLVVVLSARAGAADGIDVANYQHPNGAAIDWNAVRGGGYRFAYIKATEGPSEVGGYYTNPYFSSDWNAAGQAGLLRGAYHFARPQHPLDSAVQQARYFVSVTGTMHGLVDLPPVLDLESTGGLNRTEMTLWTQSWLNEVERLTGRRPIIYAGYYFWNDNVGSTNFGSYRLWMPRYTSAPDPFPLPNSWETWTFWQWSSSGRVPGIIGNVDLNHFCCPDTSLAALADGSGSNPAASNPFGSLDAASRGPTTLTVNGWAIDPDTTSSVNVHVYVDGALRTIVPADQERGDLAAVYPGWGLTHGWSATVLASAGPHQVCAYAINKFTGNANTTLGCRVVASNPAGSLDTALSFGTGQLTIGGWAIDPDTTGPIKVHTYIDGRGAAISTANEKRDDVGAAFPAFGANHGYTATVSGLSPGWHFVCSYAINAGSGDANTEIGCRLANVLASDPVGEVVHASGGPASAYVRGWAIDPDAVGPINVHVWVDGKPHSSLVANELSAEGAAAYPDHGDHHGFSTVIPGLAAGQHTVCTYGINVGPGGNALINCAPINVLAGNPLGSLDEVSTRFSFITARGWAMDPDVAAPITIHLYIDGKIAGAFPASDERGDVGAVFPLYGAKHGFSITLDGFGGGTHTVCAYGINVGGGGNALVGCGSVTLTGDPFGSLDTAVPTNDGKTVTVTGWMIDPDTTAPGVVHVYVDGNLVAALASDKPRADVGDTFAPYGDNHGFTGVLSGLTSGAHTVCAYGINVGPGGNALLNSLQV